MGIDKSSQPINRRVLPLTVGFAEGEVFITIGVDQLRELVNQNNCFSSELENDLAVDALAEQIVVILSTKDEDGTTLVSRMLDQACAQAAEEPSEFYLNYGE